MMDSAQIKMMIQEALETVHVEVHNPREDGLHFEAFVVSPAFTGKSLVEQHQMVMLPLKKHFEGALHALSLKTLTPEAWDEQRSS